MGKSINPMCDFLKPKPQGETMTGSALRLIVLMSLQPAIPWRVALLHCPPPLHRLDTILHRPANFVNHHLSGAGEFSTGTMGNFQPELTLSTKSCQMALALRPLESPNSMASRNTSQALRPADKVWGASF